MKNIYELSNDEIVAYLVGEVENIGVLANGKQIIATEQTLDSFTPLKAIPDELAGQINQLKLAKRKELKLARDKAISTPLNNIQVASGDDLRNIEGAILAFDRLSSSGKLAWVMADNSIGELSKDDLINLRDSYIDRKQALFNAFALACAKLEMANLPSEISGIELDKGVLDV